MAAESPPRRKCINSSCPRPYFRIAQIVSFVIALPLCIAHAAIDKGNLLAIPLPQMGFVAGYALCRLWPSNNVIAEARKRYPDPVFGLTLNALATITPFAVSVFAWATLCRWTRSEGILIRFATIPLMIHVGIHLFFVYDTLWHDFGLRNWVPKLTGCRKPNEDPKGVKSEHAGAPVTEIAVEEP